VLPAARRRRFLTEMEERLRDFLEIAERVQREGRGAGPYFQLMARGATAMQKTRLDWLRSVTAALSNGGMGSGPPKRSR
jgi:hypothetical protein